MSHVATVDVTITDLAALKAAVKELGAHWREGKETYEWYGASVGDYPLPAGMTAEDLGKCSHAIGLPGVRYEIGVVKRRDGNGYTLAFDFYGNSYGSGKSAHDGHRLLEHFGPNCQKLAQRYGVCAAEAVARSKGMVSRRTYTSNGNIQLRVTV